MSQELPNGIKTMLRSFNQFIPYLNRIINDYDALKGEYWKPPTNAEACEMVPRAFRDEWLQANKALARWLVNALNQNFLTRFTCTYSYGSSKINNEADMDDGLSLAFALVTLSSPNSSDTETPLTDRFTTVLNWQPLEIRVNSWNQRGSLCRRLYA